MKKIAVIGAGLTGLTTAYYLQKRGFEVCIFEKSSKVGGVIQTESANGFIFENGPSTGALGSIEAVRLLLDDLADKCELEIADENAKFRWILKEGQWHALPSGFIGGVRTPLFTFSDKLRLLREPFCPKGTDPQESLADLVRRRMGKSFLTYAVDPFILGIYSGDPEKLVTRFAMPKLYRLEQDYGSFIRGAIQKRKLPKTEDDKRVTKDVFSVKGGLSNLISALKDKIGEEYIRTNISKLAVNPENNCYRLVSENCPDGELFDQVVSTVGGYALRDLFPFLKTEQLSLIEEMPYAKVIQISVGFKQWKGMPIKAFGGLIPFKENRDVLGALFLSSFLKDRAPEGGALISTFLGGIRRPDVVNWTDDQINETVRKELTDLLEIRDWNPDLIKINHYQHAIPQYGRESEKKLQVISEIEKAYPGLILGGNIRDGIGMSDRIKQGFTIAQNLNK